MQLHPVALAAEKKEVDSLQSKGVWDLLTVRPWKEVAREAREAGRKVHMGYIFCVCVEKGF